MRCRLAIVLPLAVAVAVLAGACDRELARDRPDPLAVEHGSAAPLPTPRLEVIARQVRKARNAWMRVRAARETRLVRHGPAPLRWDEPEPPPGVERVAYRSGDLELAAWLAVPPGRPADRRLPAVVYLHGWFGLRRDAWEGAERFLDRGFVVLVPMLRGENGNPGDFEMFYGELDDAAAAVRWLAERPEVDHRHVYAFGHSVGGGVAALLSLVPDLPLVSTASCGGVYVDDIFDSWRRIVPFDRDDPLEVRLRMLRPNLRDMQRPHHAYVGRSDGILRYAKRMKRAARRRHAPFSLQIVAGDHFSSLPRAIDAFIASIRKPHRSRH